MICGHGSRSKSAEKEFLLNGKPVPPVVAIVNGGQIESNFLVNEVKIWKITRQRQGISVTDKEEKEYGNRGLIKIEDFDGEKLICRNCFEGV